MTVRVIALESCSATHLLPVSRMRSQSGTELLHEGPQLQLGVGLNFTRTRQKLSIQIKAGRAQPRRDSVLGEPSALARMPVLNRAISYPVWSLGEAINMCKLARLYWRGLSRLIPAFILS
jgi:hypothetical protein